MSGASTLDYLDRRREPPSIDNPPIGYKRDYGGKALYDQIQERRSIVGLVAFQEVASDLIEELVA